MLALTRIFLHNWHRFAHHVIDVEDSLYLAGHNGSGKSSVLDAIQLVLIADLTQIRFNSSAQERSHRSLDSYVRGKIGEGRLLRPGDTVAYVALEFTNTANRSHITAGVCVEAGEGRTPERTFFLLPDALDPALFVPDGRERSRRQLREAIRQRRGGRSFDQVGEYRDEIRNRLGGLNQRFFDLFLRALTFQPIRDIRDFVEQWLLERRSLELDTLQNVTQRLADLRLHAREVEAKLAALQTIVEQQAEVRRLSDRHAEYTLLAVLLQEAAAQQRATQLATMVDQLTQEIAAAEHEHTQAQAAFTGAQQAYVEAEVRLKQSDVVRRQDDLRREIERLAREADTLRQRWAELRRDLRREAELLQPIIELGFSVDERPAIDRFQRSLLNLAQSAPTAELTAAIDQAIPVLDGARERAQEQRYAIDQRIRELRDRQATLRADLARLRDPASRPIYPKDVDRLRDLLTPVVGERPPLLCELLDIRDTRWQDAVEALLGARRFNLIVPPKLFPAALRELDRARAAEQLYDVGLLDLDKARSEGRPARPRSLALQVETQVPLLRAYIDSILGDIITCDTVDELREHRRSVTPDVVVYSEWTARAIPPSRYRPWSIGQQARQSQIAAIEEELLGIDAELTRLEPRQRDLRALAAGLDRGRTLSVLRERLDAPLDDQPLRQDIAAAEAELQSLDLSGVIALQREVERLTAVMEHERGVVERLIKRLAQSTERHEVRQSELQHAQSQLAFQRQRVLDEQARLGEIAASAAALLAERRNQPELDLSDAIRNAETTARNFETRAANALQRLTELGTTYNTRYQFAAIPHNPHETRYADEQRRLGATELPRFSSQIEQAQREAEEELREHVLHRLREQIVRARAELERINDALRPLQFHGERYRFIAEPAAELREYYDLISDAQVLGTTALFESEFYERHKGTFDQFYEALTRTPQSEVERLEQERLTDYRRYLSYDIEVRHADGGASKLSKIMGQTSGGETQTPFYLTIAASFVQLYRINERSGQPTIRLVAFDEAFSKMDQDRIGATLDLFQHFKLQVITATPLERCEYLVPKMCTSLVLTGVGDQVLIEPYRNYAARLETFDVV